ncbi:major facilitator superfamily domain-containing protein [Schizophyllum amplum]|uniref:Major facilitator superfamily domain-containing protein n=1 Tax=Schizophyllum amplum TaxID=97359 RepID=A0A550C1G7_9AGAR|nr:major facilitator superfamily domain-containing protein [Auriculariopsis ampla]
MATEETRPLLAEDVEQSPERPKKETPLPLRQLSIVYLIQFCEPLTGLVIYPFIAELVQETGITGGDPKAIGYYAGIVESLFFFSEFLTCMQWGRLSDYHGRRPILLIAPLGLALATYGFGFAKSFWLLCVFRFLQGVFNGNVGVSKSVMAEVTDSTNRARAFSIMPLNWSVATTLAPFIGGTLSNPAKHFPDVFGGVRLFEEYPYLLPCVFSATGSLLVFIFAYFYLIETLPSAVKKGKNSRLSSSASSTTTLEEERTAEGYGTISDEARASEAEVAPPPSANALLRDPYVAKVLLAYVVFVFGDMSLSALVPIILYAPIKNGGLGFTPLEIGTIMGVWGIYNIVFQLVVSPYLIKRFGPRPMQMAAVTATALMATFLPLENFVARRAGHVNGLALALLALQYFCLSFTYIGYGTIHMYIIDSAPTHNSMGAVNGLAQAMATLGRTSAPWLSTSLLSLSLEKDILGGRLVFLLIISMACIAFLATTRLPKHLRNAH